MANNRISPSKKEIYTKLLDIAEKYTDIENRDFLKTGLFGYITESLAMAMRDSSYQKTMLYNESFLNTAVIPKSVYNWAKMFNIEIQKATPSYADIEIKINSESLDAAINALVITPEQIKKYNLPSDKLDTHGIILDKTDPIYAGDYVFSLEHSIIITKPEDSILAQYVHKLNNIEEETATSYQDNSLIPKNLNVYTDENQENIIILARAYQYQTKIITRQIPSASFLNKVQIYNFDNQFCGAKLYFISNNENTEISLQYSELKSTTNNLVAFYNLNDEHELAVSFKYGDEYFMPTANSQLKMILYTTNGSSVPSTFSGDAYMMISDNDLKALPIVIQFNPTNIIGGKNAPTIDEIRKTIINEISTRNTITTESDLKRYFSIITALIEDINNGKVEFKKQRDDILKRSFNAYLLLRDNFNEITNEKAGSDYLSACVPTNTINAEITMAKAANNMYFCDFPRFADTDYRYLDKDSTSENYYISPFSIFIMPSDTNTPCPFVKFIYNLVNQTKILEYNKQDFSSHYIQPKTISLMRASSEIFIPDSYYKMTLQFITDFPLVYCKDENAYSLKENSSIEITFDNASSLTISQDQIDANSVKNENGTYTTNIECRIDIDSDNEFDMDNDTYNIRQILKNNNNNVYINSKNTMFIRLNNLNIVSDTGESFSFGGDDSIFVGKDLSFFEHMDTIMNSSLGESMSENEEIFTITELPVIHSSFFANEENRTLKIESFTKQLFTYIKVLKDNLNRLETSTFFNMKFYNTYGPSIYYNTPTTNLRLEMIITLLKTYEGPEYNNLRKEIVSYIRKIIDRMNDDQTIKISTLISLLTNESTYGKYISHVEFVGLNNSFEQYITTLDIHDDNTIYNPIPEWLNIQSNYKEDNTGDIKFNYTEY